MSVLVAIAFANCNRGGVLASKASMADRPPSGDGELCVTRSEAWRRSDVSDGDRTHPEVHFQPPTNAACGDLRRIASAGQK